MLNNVDLVHAHSTERSLVRQAQWVQSGSIYMHSTLNIASDSHQDQIKYRHVVKNVVPKDLPSHSNTSVTMKVSHIFQMPHSLCHT